MTQTVSPPAALNGTLNMVRIASSLSDSLWVLQHVAMRKILLRQILSKTHPVTPEGKFSVGPEGAPAPPRTPPLLPPSAIRTAKFSAKKIFGRKFFWSKNVSTDKVFGRIFFRPKIVRPKNFRSNFFLTENFAVRLRILHTFWRQQESVAYCAHPKVQTHTFGASVA